MYVECQVSVGDNDSCELRGRERIPDPDPALSLCLGAFLRSPFSQSPLVYLIPYITAFSQPASA